MYWNDFLKLIPPSSGRRQAPGKRPRPYHRPWLEALEDRVLLNADSPLSLTINDVVVTESCYITAHAWFAVELSAPSLVPVSVNYTTVAGTAEAGVDFIPVSGTLTFAPPTVGWGVTVDPTTGLPHTILVDVPGETSKTIEVPVLPNYGDAPTETFFVLLSDPVNAGLGDGSGQATIQDALPPTVSTGNVSATEGASAVFTVTLSGESEYPVTVAYATEDGTAQAGSDYSAAAGTLTFAPPRTERMFIFDIDRDWHWEDVRIPGETSKTVLVPVLDDPAVEDHETFYLRLSDPTNATLGQSTGVASIANDDRLLTVEDVAVLEQGVTTQAVFTVRLSSIGDQPVSVDYLTVAGTAEAGVDFTPVSGTLTFAPMTMTEVWTVDPATGETRTILVVTPPETSKTIEVPVLANGGDAPAETFFVQLFNPVNAGLDDGSAQATIQDAPQPVYLDYLMSEGGALIVATVPVDSTSFNVTRPPKHGSLEVDTATGQLSYTPDSDYIGTDSFAFTAPDGSGNPAKTTVSVVVSAVNDAPTFTPGADLVVNEDSGAHVFAGWATNLIPGPADESGQALTFVVTDNTNPGLFATPPAIDPATGDLTFTPAAGTAGSAVITVVLRDDGGGTEEDGVDTSLPQTFTITVQSAVQAPMQVLHFQTPGGSGTGSSVSPDLTLTNFLTVQVYGVSGSTRELLATFSPTGTGSERLRLAGNHYHVNFHPGREQRAQTYQIQVRVAGLDLGHATVSAKGQFPIRFQVDNAPAIRTRVLHEQGLNASDAAGVLRAEFALGAPDTARLLSGDLNPYGAAAVGQALQVVFGLNATDSAQALNGAGYGVTDVAAALRDVYEQTPEQTAQVLREISYSAGAVAQALSEVFGLIDWDAAQILKDAGYGALDVAGALRDVYQQMPEQTALILRDIFGQTAPEVGQTLKAIGLNATTVAGALVAAFPATGTNRPIEDPGGDDGGGGGVAGETVSPQILEVAFSLKSAGYTALSIARSLKAYFAVTPTLAAKALHIIAFGARDIARALGAEFAQSAGQAASILKSIGHNAPAIAAALKGAFALGTIAAAQALQQAAFDIFDIALGLRDAFFLNVFQVADVLFNIGSAADAIAAAVAFLLGLT